MNSRFGTGRLVEESQGAREIVIRIRGDQTRGRALLQRLRNQDRGGAAMFHFGRVFRICEKSELRGSGVLHAGHARDCDTRVAFELAAEFCGQIAKRDSRSGHNVYVRKRAIRMAAVRQSAIRFIVALGTISLFADITYEGARSVNGPFLGTLGATAAMVGIISGAGELAGYLLRLFSGIAVDRTRAYWTLTIAGYVVNLLAVPLMAFAGQWGVAAALIIAERAGKAVRTPARDVMLSQASSIVGRGWGFGLHEFMDQLGAFIGPLLVALALKESHQYARAYGVLAIPACLALASLFTAIKFYPDPARFEEKHAPAGTPGTELPRAFWIYVAGAGLVAAGFVDFPLIAFHFQKTSLATLPEIPVFYAVAMGLEALAALLFGKLFDRLGASVLIIGVVMSAASSALAFLGSFYVALAGVALWGAGMGAQQALLRAKIGDLVPPEKRGAAYGIFNTVYGILWFAGSSAVGILYGRSLVSAVVFATVTQVAAIPLLFIAGRKSS